MKKFKEMRKISDIERIAKEKGFNIDMSEFNKGDDWFWIRDIHNRKEQICINCFGYFEVYKPYSETPVATHLSDNFDNEDWYSEILDIIYKSEM